MADIKDRQSNMAYSHLNAQPKKDGAGGGYTWGKETDVQDYIPQGVQQSNVVVLSQPGQVVFQQSVPYSASPAEFPSLVPVVTPAPVQWPAQPLAAPVTYAAAPAAPPTMVVREGVDFNQSHPRNQFAVKPQLHNYGQVVQAVDWNTTGMPQQVQSVVLAGGGKAHLSPVAAAQPAQQIPLSVLKSQVYAQPQYAPSQQVAYKPHTKFIHQPRK